MENIAGGAAALGTAFLWSFTYVLFTMSVRAIGARALNRLRLAIALGLLVGAHWVVHGTPLPLGVELSRWGWLTLSGVIGFAISDAMLFRALYHLGAHRTSLVMTLVPVAGALLAWLTLGETMSLAQTLAALTTIVGVTVVIAQRPHANPAADGRRPALGVGLALCSVVAQAARYILSKQGMSGGFSPLSTNVLQILAASVAVWGIALATGRVRETARSLRVSRAAWTTLGGAFTGPFLGVTLSLVALARAPVGIASTLMGMTPVFLLPLSRLVFRERLTIRAVIGTVIAVAGAAALLLT